MQKGVKVKICSDNHKAEDFRAVILSQWQKKGVSVRIDKTENHMHHKFAIFDNKNFSKRKLQLGLAVQLCITTKILLFQNDHQLILKFDRQFNYLWQSFKAYPV